MSWPAVFIVLVCHGLCEQPSLYLQDRASKHMPGCFLLAFLLILRGIDDLQMANQCVPFVNMRSGAYESLEPGVT